VRGRSAQCPAHEDRAPSLSIGQRKDGNGVVLNCHAGCDPQDVVTALGLTMADLFDEPLEKRERPQVAAEYVYPDEQGEVLYVVRRLEPGYDGERKTFRQFRPDGTPGVKGIRRVLYRLPDVIAEAQAGGTILVVEGEKDADNLAAIGAVATCNVGGAGKWSDDYTASLRGASEVVVIADRDDPGRKHAEAVYRSVHAIGIPVRILEPAKGKDVSDHLAAGLGYEDLMPLDSGRADDQPPEPEEPPAGADEQRPRKLVLTPASKIRIRPVRWLWDTTPEGAPPTSHGRVPLYSLAIAAGGPGLGKSQFAVWLTAHITTGTLPGELWGKPRGVIYAATEDSWSYTIAPRLIAAGADMDLVFRVDVQDDEEVKARLTLPVDTSLIGKAAEEYSVALLVADPLLSLIDKGINDYRAAEVRQALEPLVAAAERYNFTILGLAHFTKAGVADPLSRIAGSGAFGQLIRSFIAFAREDTDDGDQRFVMSLEKNNLGRLGLPSHSYVIQPVTVETDEGPAYISRFVLGPETNTSVRDVMREESAPAGDKAEGDEIRMWLRDFLTDLGGSAENTDVMKEAQKRTYSRPAVYRAKTKLKLVTRQSGFGKSKTSVWYLPEAAPVDEPEEPDGTR
jgi:5S rRNA maturation endonuclease (ribonuclease M5)